MWAKANVDAEVDAVLVKGAGARPEFASAITVSEEGASRYDVAAAVAVAVAVAVVVAVAVAVVVHNSIDVSVFVCPTAAKGVIKDHFSLLTRCFEYYAATTPCEADPVFTLKVRSQC